MACASGGKKRGMVRPLEVAVTMADVRLPSLLIVMHSVFMVGHHNVVFSIFVVFVCF